MRRWFHFIFRKEMAEKQLNSELSFHLEQQTRKYISAGLSPEEALRKARLDFGGLDQIKEECRDARGIRWLDELGQDLRYALRTLHNNQGFTAVVIVTLALGIGANTAIFSLIDAVLFRPVAGIAEPDRLVQMGRRSAQKPWIMQVSYPNYRDWRDQNQVFSHVAAYKNIEISMSSEGISDRVQGSMVSANYFDALGVKPALGRAFLKDDDLIPGSRPVAVVSYAFWQSRFAGDPSFVGKTIELNRHPFTVVGVAARGFNGSQLGQKVEIWVPITMITDLWPDSRGALAKRYFSFIAVIGRLKPGIGLQQAQANMDTVARRLEIAWPDENKDIGVSLARNVGLFPFARERAIQFSAILAAVVGLVLMIACANVANLLLARGATRQKEIAVRLALGAGRARLVRQLLVENVFLALAGGFAGVLAAYWTNGLFSRVAISTSFLPATDYALDGSVLCFAAVLSFLTGIAVGIFPALQSSKADQTPALKESAPLRSLRLGPRNALVVSQIALSLILLIVAGMLIRALLGYLNVNPGFDSKNVLCATLDLNPEGIPKTQQHQLFGSIMERVRALPGVASASLASEAPMAAINMTTVTDYGRGLVDLPLNFTYAGSGYFRTLGIALLRGRDFNDRDDTESAKVAIINEVMAQGLWPGENAIGKIFVTSMRLSLDSPGQAFEVIGVARDSRDTLLEKAEMKMYIPQQYQGLVTLLVRSTADPITLMPQLRREIYTLDKNGVLFNGERLSDKIRNTLKPLDAASTIISFFALLALILAGIGIYGVISYRVTLQTHEIGIRMALGAQRPHVLGLVIRRGMILAFTGVAIGALGGFLAARFLSRMPIARDVLHEAGFATFALVVFLLLFVALLAIYIPARRAAQVDPLTALRYE